MHDSADTEGNEWRTWRRHGAIFCSRWALPLVALLSRPGEAAAQASGGSPGKVDTKGLTAKIKFESVLSGYLTDLNGKYKLRVTELVLEPGGYVGEHHHGPRDPPGDVGLHDLCPTGQDRGLWPRGLLLRIGRRHAHGAEQDRTPMVHILLEILPADHKGPSIMPAKH